MFDEVLFLWRVYRHCVVLEVLGDARKFVEAVAFDEFFYIALDRVELEGCIYCQVLYEVVALVVIMQKGLEGLRVYSGLMVFEDRRTELVVDLACGEQLFAEIVAVFVVDSYDQVLCEVDFVPFTETSVC